MLKVALMLTLSVPNDGHARHENMFLHV